MINLNPPAVEYNFDGLIGPTHNFAGLAVGNFASQQSRYQTSHPKSAALQGLKKMKLLYGLGIKQGIFPPQERPSFKALRLWGYVGTEREIFDKVRRENPEWLLACYSSSSMWAANAATVSPSADTADLRIHITPANLKTQRHRSIEYLETVPLLKKIFPEGKIFCHHPVVNGAGMTDEGAADHMRLCPAYGQPGIEIFVYGHDATKSHVEQPKNYPARQSFSAAMANAESHGIPESRRVFVQQNPEAIDKGVFHNDVIAVSNQNVLLFHEQAFLDSPRVINEITAKFSALSSEKLCLFEIKSSQLSLEDAVRSYFFNSQIVSQGDGRMVLIAPRECQTDKNVQSVIAQIISGDHPIKEVRYVDLAESMANGGGPACLRLRVEFLPREESAINPAFILNDDRFCELEKWIVRHYRDRLAVADLQDFSLVEESRRALDALTQILGCGPIYDFQRG